MSAIDFRAHLARLALPHCQNAIPILTISDGARSSWSGPSKGPLPSLCASGFRLRQLQLHVFFLDLELALDRGLGLDLALSICAFTRCHLERVHDVLGARVTGVVQHLAGPCLCLKHFFQGWLPYH